MVRRILADLRSYCASCCSACCQAHSQAAASHRLKYLCPDLVLQSSAAACGFEESWTAALAAAWLWQLPDDRQCAVANAQRPCGYGFG